jgi:hypothetical protein
VKSGQPDKPEHFNRLEDEQFVVWVPKGMTFENDLVKILAFNYKGNVMFKVSTAMQMIGEGYGN